METSFLRDAIDRIVGLAEKLADQVERGDVVVLV